MSKSIFKKVFKALAVSALIFLIVGGTACYFYWRYLKTTPQYSLALIVDAAKRGDQETANSLVDTDAIVDDFVPQITAKAIEIYGRGIPPERIAKLANLARPLMPALKDRARAEMPTVIQERTEDMRRFPFVVIVVGAGRYLDITVQGDMAVVKSKIPDRPFELKMQKDGDRWRITGVKDDQLAAAIAQKVGQQIVAVASKGVSGAGDSLGIGDLSDMLRQAEEIFNDN